MTVDFEKSPGLGLFGKSGAGKQQRLLSLAQFLAGARVYLVDGKNESFQALFCPTTCPGVSDVLSMPGYVVAQMEQRETLKVKEYVRDV